MCEKCTLPQIAKYLIYGYHILAMDDTKAPHSGLAAQADALDALDKRILALELERPGITNKAISEVIELKPNAISQRRKAPLYQRTLHEALKGPLEIIKDGQAKAARKLIKLLDAKKTTPDGQVVDDTATQLSAAATILKPVLPHAVIHGTTDDFERMLSDMSEDQLNRFLTEGAAVINESEADIIDVDSIKDETEAD